MFQVGGRDTPEGVDGGDAVTAAAQHPETIILHTASLQKKIKMQNMVSTLCMT